MSFLAFKKAGIPTGSMVRVVFNQIATDILDEFYKASSTYDGYYNPLKTSDPSNRWVAKRYPSTSLQRITADTFKDALLHKKGTSEWGWRDNYVLRLRKRVGDGIPAFALAAWLYRTREWPRSVRPKDLVAQLFSEFQITTKERSLFDESASGGRVTLSATAIEETALLDHIGYPPGALAGKGGSLRRLEMVATGPSKQLLYGPNDRLNLITGDNSLGKTFLLECIWWALVGEWTGRQALPSSEARKSTPRIAFDISDDKGGLRHGSASYDWGRLLWTRRTKKETLAGLAVYARYDGSYAFWDPVLALAAESTEPEGHQLVLTGAELWSGKRREGHRERWLCNGLILDWVAWQTSGDRHDSQFRALTAALQSLSPSSESPLTPGEPARLSLDSRDMPTLAMPYGEIPLQIASAGVQRAVSIAYALVWSWFEHVARCQSTRRNPERRLILLVDEVEAHLHPRWQRTIVPALIEVVQTLSSDIAPQLHVATHSPMVMASAEEVFDEERDGLHHLELRDNDVSLSNLPFVRRGRVDQWLMSNVFGLAQPRSQGAEQAIEAARALQQAKSVESADVCELHAQLVRYLAPDDDFWPRWVHFAKRHGLDV